ncbi:hypothetical protein HN832_04085 [archaeon]|jgi:hypothetical protein|nr:hypothetical protein [archaeon]MBT4373426.1 hypothetical protein [archaeon]MBT4531874.1 hypothetical protein [archaeon]MBT7001541.1 hypothetical protein [archaeon]MBT7282567.1 hypothetical protein [archaeon]
MTSLYAQLKESEGINDEIRQEFDEVRKKFEGYRMFEENYMGPTLEDLPWIDMSEYQKQIIRAYEENPVLKDAINGKITIGDSLRELSDRVDKPVWRLFPRRRNKVHNERLGQTKELVSRGLNYLRTDGILAPDNFVGMVAITAAMAYTIAPLLCNYLTGGVNPAPSAEIQAHMEFMTQVFPPFMTSTAGLMMGWACQMRRKGKLPLEEAEYLDNKVEEFYR